MTLFVCTAMSGPSPSGGKPLPEGFRAASFPRLAFSLTRKLPGGFLLHLLNLKCLYLKIMWLFWGLEWPPHFPRISKTVFLA